ncbi:bifunctional diaminohydroxyphosphoribosylaminopyrimidine deaminase/5-amino-6-(5-phosphoribosylamino)uracil reductase RibD [Kytococcus sedentarius]|uniref:bifunctional diaminohydroxyphosphoribosylaminopyrimidine deaminase/5-amino-6-(5-phosphoribosylamino)uracil reductase RibD n=1 Tax=Kytococcus sedentarius TaxID=1276 RepID=UPI0019500EC1|nr:bifunctional diaminohydroxyphosphoribosylaminopyrimidine deaminase/5-amino-6-(5-phosphoribosylamino)uracil reductase RibD [Kytococcus sedentarius]QRO88616.1 bifunctional diaminohydroxyphosphoribosylaminopyrimidine deaminase/5-amino-6-(5-phosphoribosylamino)uracil reductase RibD [Kytococcus sedentarius]
MRRALDLAARGPAVDPNPRVGCVLLDRDGRTLGEGFHQGAGSPHAEVAALLDAGCGPAAGPRPYGPVTGAGPRPSGPRPSGPVTRAGMPGLPAGATAVVTLEPCNHTGRTGPCAEALLDAGIARVVIAQSDPTRLASGGAERLRTAGVEVVTGVLESEATALNRWFTASARLGRPVVTLKLASTLDGRVAAADGTSQWITGGPARLDVHRQRATAGAIVVGTGTALADDPQLTVRLPAAELAPRQPLRVVVGTRELPASARVFDDAAETISLRTHDPAEVLRVLSDRGIHHVWLEGGPTLAAAFLRAGLVDRLVHYLAPALLGAGPSLVGDLGIGSIDGIDRWHLEDVTHLGDDLRLTLVPAAGPTPATPATPEGA